MVRRCREKVVLFSVGAAQEETEGFDALDLPDMPEAHAGNGPRQFACKAFRRVGTVVQKFTERPNLCMRRGTHIKSKSVEDRLPQMNRLHRKLPKVIYKASRHHGSTVGSTASDGVEIEWQPGRNPAFGCFQPDEQFNVDQVGLGFVNGMETTYDEKGRKRVHLLQSFTDLENRQRTVNICFGLGYKLMRPTSDSVQGARYFRLTRERTTPVLVYSSKRAPGWTTLRAWSGLSGASFEASRVMRTLYRRSSQSFFWTTCTRRRRMSLTAPSQKSETRRCGSSAVFYR